MELLAIQAVQIELSVKRKLADRAEYDLQSAAKVAGLLIGGVMILPSGQPRHVLAYPASLAVCVGAGDHAALMPHLKLVTQIGLRAALCPHTVPLPRASRTVRREHRLLAACTDLSGPSTKLLHALHMPEMFHQAVHWHPNGQLKMSAAMTMIAHTIC